MIYHDIGHPGRLRRALRAEAVRRRAIIIIVIIIIIIISSSSSSRSSSFARRQGNAVLGLAACFSSRLVYLYR